MGMYGHVEYAKPIIQENCINKKGTDKMQKYDYTYNPLIQLVKYKLIICNGYCPNESVGDYKEMEDGTWNIYASDINGVNKWYPYLILIHELLEQIITEHQNIPEPLIAAFDEFFMELKKAKMVPEKMNAGDHPMAPYKDAHQFIELKPERDVATKIGIDFDTYMKDLDTYIDEMEALHAKTKS
jgi:hypothetical protein